MNSTLETLRNLSTKELWHLSGQGMKLAGRELMRRTDRSRDR